MIVYAEVELDARVCCGRHLGAVLASMAATASPSPARLLRVRHASDPAWPLHRPQSAPCAHYTPPQGQERGRRCSTVATWHLVPVVVDCVPDEAPPVG